MYIQEVLSKPGESSKPIEQQEYWEMRILEPGELSRSGYYVISSHFAWSPIDQRLMSQEGEIDPERYPTLESAKQGYEAQRTVLIRQGFQSDMDL